MYAPFVSQWLSALPGSLLALRTEDLAGGEAARRATLRAAWRHLGLREPSDEEMGGREYARAEGRIPDDYAAWTEGKGPILPETRALLHTVYDGMNVQLAALLRADGVSCGPAAAVRRDVPCDAFLWAEDVA